MPNIIFFTLFNFLVWLPQIIINSSNASKNIKLIDKQGRLVLESIISKETNTINLAHLESGNYLLFIEGNDSPIQIIKK